MEKLQEFELSKSRLMLFNLCPFKFKRIYLDEKDQLESSFLLKGTYYHMCREAYLKSVCEFKLSLNFNENFDYIRKLLPPDQDIVFDCISNVEADRATKIHPSLFAPVFMEQTYKTVFTEPGINVAYPEYKNADINNLLEKDHIEELKEKYGITPIIKVSSRIDEIYLCEDGNFRIFEFKTGSWNSGSASKIRKELLFYKAVADPHLCTPIQYISYHFAHENRYVIEKINNRSITAMKKLVYEYIKANLENKFKQKYYKITCDKNCQFAEECKLVKINTPYYELVRR